MTAGRRAACARLGRRRRPPALPCTRGLRTRALRAGVRVVGVSAGRYSTLALDATGALHSWGLEACATNGSVPAKEAAWSARRVGGDLTGQRVVGVSTGACAAGARACSAPLVPARACQGTAVRHARRHTTHACMRA